MPIKGLSEIRRLPRLGKIHLGIKKSKVVEGKGEVTYPSAVDYFVFSPDNALFPELVKVFGEKPKELRILIPVEDEEKWASQYYRAYSQSRGLLCKGDGETAMCMVDVRTGAMADHSSTEVVMKEIKCQGKDCSDYEKTCREIMNLQFLLPEVPGLGIWQIDTSSTNSIKNINSAAYLIKRIHGHISMIPLLLTIEPIEAPDPQGIKRKINVLNLRINRTIIEMAETIKTPLLVAAELPIADDEVPDMVIPQVQEEKVTPPVVVPPGMDEKKGKPKTDKAPPTSKKKEPPPPPDPEATQDEKKAIIVALKAKGITDQQQIRDFFVSGTGKKGGWLHSDMVKLQNSLKAPSKEEVDAQADAFLKELGLT